MALLLIPVAAWMGYYNYRVTGHALELPYVAHDRQYALLEPVLWADACASRASLQQHVPAGLLAGGSA